MKTARIDDDERNHGDRRLRVPLIEFRERRSVESLREKDFFFSPIEEEKFRGGRGGTRTCKIRTRVKQRSDAIRRRRRRKRSQRRRERTREIAESQIGEKN